MKKSMRFEAPSTPHVGHFRPGSSHRKSGYSVETVKSLRSMWITLISFLAVLAMPFGAMAQVDPTQNSMAKHHHYKLIDVGTFGGPGSGIENPSSPSLNQNGMLVGASDTAAPDPFAPNCFFDCNVELGFFLHNGVVTPLLPLPSGAGLSSAAYAINRSGQVVGQAQNGTIDESTGWPETHAVLWQGSPIPIDLTPSVTQSIANAINGHGQVVGAALTATPDPFANSPLFGSVSEPGCENPNAYGIPPPTFAVCSIFFPGTTETHAFVWQNGFMRDLHTLGGPDSNAFINNDNGEVAGWSFTSFVANASTGVPTMDPFYWSPEDGKMTDLGGLGGTLGAAVWINNRGQIAGVSNIAGDVTTHPFIWSKSEGMQDLFLNGGLGGTFGHPDAMNDLGEVVGYAMLPGDQIGHAFLWRDGVLTDLGTLGTDAQSESVSINSRGQVVGGTFTVDFHDLRGFLWENGGPPVDLNALIIPESDTYVDAAVLINDRGDIGCLGLDPGDSDEHACLLIPCDENHPGIEGCDYSLVDAPAATEVHTLDITKASAAAASQPKLSPAEMMARFRSMRAGRHRPFGALQPASK
jgi:probable HAF family extracellular repeat protein